MFLIIDSVNSRFALLSKEQKIKDINWQENVISESLVIKIKENLGDNELEAVIVIQGQGSFSQAREAVVIANMLHLAKNTPVYSFDEAEFGIASSITDLSIDSEETDYLLPVYEGEPNIG